jgi:hypothetical protein
MGKFHSTHNNVIQTVEGSINGYYSSPAYFNNAVHYSGWLDFLERYTLTNGLLSTMPVSESPTKFAQGNTPSISANGSTNGIVWAVERVSSTSSVLHAYNASDVSKELYNSNHNAARDSLGGSKFPVPTIANGKVYVGTFTGLVVYGILLVRAGVALAILRPAFALIQLRLPRRVSLRQQSKHRERGYRSHVHSPVSNNGHRKLRPSRKLVPGSGLIAVIELSCNVGGVIGLQNRV